MRGCALRKVVRNLAHKNWKTGERERERESHERERARAREREREREICMARMYAFCNFKNYISCAT